ncbi:MAG: TIGR00725 family protein [candidate division Zixibacteria bacterium]|nr:TIGR00725 family protein [candidate division Zixibacteria bacterium]
MPGTTIRKKPFIGVIGAGQCSWEMKELAERVGRAIAENNAILVCGGLGGVMAAAAKGAKSKNGMTIGILPGDSKNEANEFIDLAIPTGIGDARNLIIVKTADAIVALPGKYGTLSEMAFCMKLKKPLVSLSAWDISETIEKFKNPIKAVKRAIELAGR